MRTVSLSDRRLSGSGSDPGSQIVFKLFDCDDDWTMSRRRRRRVEDIFGCGESADEVNVNGRGVVFVPVIGKVEVANWVLWSVLCVKLDIIHSSSST